MSRIRGLMWLVIIVAAAFGLYLVKYRVQNLQNEIASLKEELNQERENLHVVGAEWAYLTRPDRLQKLVSQMQLTPVQSIQIGDVAQVPFPMVQTASSEPKPGVTPVSLERKD